MSAHFIVQSILALENGFSKERKLRYYQIKKLDPKIKMLGWQQIIQIIEKRSGALFPSAAAPKVVIGRLSALHALKIVKREESTYRSKRARPSLRTVPSKRLPIGLKRCDSHSWINSLIQFLLFLPWTWELFSLIPKSFQPLQKFADQYAADQEDNLSVSSVDSREWIQCLSSKLPLQLLQNKPSLYDILSAFVKALFPYFSLSTLEENHSVVLHPEWHLIFESFPMESTLQNERPILKNWNSSLENKLNEGPPELLIGLRGLQLSLKSHYFAPSDGASYDLDAFIESRPDGEQGEQFIAYLKRGGAWSQCDDERVVQFRSHCLNAPLRRATLLHYKRADLSSSNNTIYQNLSF